MIEALPSFRYHPDPVASGAFVESNDACVVCGRARGYLYVGPVYAVDEYHDEICPWCIGDGSASREFDATFTDDAGVGGFGGWQRVARTVVAEVTQRTPGFSGWQQERWFTCCEDAGAFLTRAGKSELVALGVDALQAIQAEAGLAGPHDTQRWLEYLNALDADGSPRAYVFRCLHCGNLGGYSDCD